MTIKLHFWSFKKNQWPIQPPFHEPSIHGLCQCFDLIMMNFQQPRIPNAVQRGVYFSLTVIKRGPHVLHNSQCHSSSWTCWCPVSTSDAVRILSRVIFTLSVQETTEKKRRSASRFFNLRILSSDVVFQPSLPRPCLWVPDTLYFSRQISDGGSWG